MALECIILFDVVSLSIVNQDLGKTDEIISIIVNTPFPLPIGSFDETIIYYIVGRV